MRPSLSVLIVTWNNREELLATLPALLAELEDEDEPIVVDNDSSDGTREQVAELAPDAKLIRNCENTGFAEACNRAAECASGALLVALTLTPLRCRGSARGSDAPGQRPGPGRRGRRSSPTATGPASARPAIACTSRASAGPASMGTRSAAPPDRARAHPFRAPASRSPRPPG